jgi:hypothetical protein
MSEISFTSEEKQLLIEIINSNITDLHSEIMHTDDHDFREELKNKRERLTHILRIIESSIQE